jgi:hypothetical protein
MAGSLSSARTTGLLAARIVFIDRGPSPSFSFGEVSFAPGVKQVLYPVESKKNASLRAPAFIL